MPTQLLKFDLKETFCYCQIPGNKSNVFVPSQCGSVVECQPVIQEVTVPFLSGHMTGL